MEPLDIAIVGAGIAGMSLACALAQDSDCRITLFEAKHLDPCVPADAFAVRSSAINPGSQQFLAHLGVWQALDTQRVCAYDRMQVWVPGASPLSFGGDELLCEHLGFIVENDALARALLDRVLASDQICLKQNYPLVSLDVGKDVVWLQGEDGVDHRARFVVGADGARSWLRQQMAVPLTAWDYQQQAIIANVAVPVAHQSMARQVFQAQGPLAFLPLADPKQCSIVWSNSPAESERLMGLSDDVFCEQLEEAFESCLGRPSLMSQRHAFTLRMQQAKHYVQGRVILIGDAAHTVHPMAGQGLNLALHDSFALQQVLRALPVSLAEHALRRKLRAYERARKAASWQMIAGLEGMRRVLCRADDPVRAWATLGMAGVDRCGALKRFFADCALGDVASLP